MMRSFLNTLWKISHIELMALLLSTHALAVNEVAQTFTLDGQLMLVGTTTPLSDSNAKITIEILDPTKNCLLYEEQQTVNTTSSDGYFNIQVGSTVGSAKRTALDPGQSMAAIYQNTVAITAANAPGKTCAGLSYTPTAADSRYFRVIVTPSATNVPDTLSPDTVMSSVPSALVAQTLQGYAANQFLILGSGDLTQANLQTVFATGNAAKLNTLLSVAPSSYVTKDSSSGLIQLPSGTGTPTGVAAGQIWYDSGTLKYYDGTTVQSVGSGSGIASLIVGAGLTPTGTISTGGQTIAVDTGVTVGKIVQVATGDKLPAINASNLTNLNGSAIASGAVPVANGGTGATSFANYSVIASNGSGNQVAVPGTTGNTMLQWTVTGPTWSTATYPASTTANQLLYSSANNVIGGITTANNSILTTNGSGVPAWSTASSDNFSQYALLAGRATGQTLKGGSAASENLTLDSTSHATKGYVLLNPNGGNVGIGNTGPDAALTVTSDNNSYAIANLYGYNAGNNAYVRIYNDQASSPANSGFVLSSNASANYLVYNFPNDQFQFITHGGSTPLVVQNNGNVGIGTTGPTGVLDVKATGTATSGNVFANRVHYTVNPSSASSATFRSVQTEIDYPATINSTGGIVGYSSDVTHSGTGDLGSMTGYNLYLANYTSATTNNAMGVNVGVFLSGSGNVNNGTGGYFTVYRDGSGAMTSGTGGTFNVTNAAAGTINTAIAGSFSVTNSGTISNAYGVYIGGIQGANKWSLYTTDATAPSYFAGSVGIGISPSYQLQLSTDSAAKPGTSTWTVASDERLKDIRAPFTRGLEALNGLHTIYFNYKKTNPLDLPSDKEYVGIRAQDAQKVIPESVSTDEQGYLHVTNDSIIWTAVNAIKELYRKFLDHDQHLTAQDREIASVKSEIQAKDQEIQKLKQENIEMKERLEKIEKMLQLK